MLLNKNTIDDCYIDYLFDIYYYLRFHKSSGAIITIDEVRDAIQSLIAATMSVGYDNIDYNIKPIFIKAMGSKVDWGELHSLCGCPIDFYCPIEMGGQHEFNKEYDEVRQYALKNNLIPGLYNNNYNDYV